MKKYIFLLLFLMMAHVGTQVLNGSFPEVLSSSSSKENIYSEIKKNEELNSDETNTEEFTTFDHVDFAQIANFEANVKSATTEFTLEFWSYIKPYGKREFFGFTFFWRNHLKVEILHASDDNEYKSICYPGYQGLDSTNKIQANHNFSNNWVYIVCAVNLNTQKFHHLKEDGLSSEFKIDINGQDMSGNDSSAVTKLNYTNNSVNKGRIFIRQLRLWSSYLGQPPITFNVEQKKILQNNDNLLHLYD
jgi:hypothetical protein